MGDTNNLVLYAYIHGCHGGRMYEKLTFFSTDSLVLKCHYLCYDKKFNGFDFNNNYSVKPLFDSVYTLKNRSEMAIKKFISSFVLVKMSKYGEHVSFKITQANNFNVSCYKEFNLCIAFETLKDSLQIKYPKY